MEWRRHRWKWKLVLVQESGEHWTSHVGEDVVSNEVHRVLNDNDSKFNDLMHDDAYVLVIVVEIRLSEVDFGAVHDWFEVSHVSALKLTVNVEIEIVEFKIDLTGFWKHPCVN
jgi:hypothetical protein